MWRGFRCSLKTSSRGASQQGGEVHEQPARPRLTEMRGKENVVPPNMLQISIARYLERRAKTATP